MNSLFSGLALVGVVLALLIQTMEFRLAAKERRDNLDIQSQIAKQQYFSTMASSIASLTEFERELENKKTRISANPDAATFEELGEFLFDFEQFSTLRIMIRSMRSDPEAIKFLGDNASIVLDQCYQNISLLGDLLLFKKEFLSSVYVAFKAGVFSFEGETPGELVDKYFGELSLTEVFFWSTSRRELADAYRKIVADISQYKSEGTLKQAERLKDYEVWDDSLHVLTVKAVIDSLDYSFGKSPLKGKETIVDESTED